MTTFRKNLHYYRKKFNISQSELESSTGIKREYISKMETGDLVNPTLSTMTKIADGLGVSLSLMLSERRDLNVEKEAERVEAHLLTESNRKKEAAFDKVREELARLGELLGKVNN